MSVLRQLGNCDFVFCTTCRLYFPQHHVDANSFFQYHRSCVLPEYTDYDNRMSSFEERTPVGMSQGDDIPNDYTCTLSDLELLAFAGQVHAIKPAIQVSTWSWTRRDAKPNAPKTEKYVYCVECSEYTLTKHKESATFVADHARCIRFRETSRDRNIVHSAARDPVEYGDTLPEGYSTKLSPLEELAHGY